MELEIFQDKDGNVYNIKTELEQKLILCIAEQQEKLDKIKEYLKNKNYLNVGYFIEDEEGRNVFIDVKGDILDIIKEEKYE